jgi:phage-related tail protein
MSMTISKSMSKDLDRIRVAAQELHGVLSDAAARSGGTMKGDLEAVGQKAKTVGESVKASLTRQNEATKEHLKEAVADLEAIQKHAAEALKAARLPRERRAFHSFE